MAIPCCSGRSHSKNAASTLGQVRFRGASSVPLPSISGTRRRSGRGTAYSQAEHFTTCFVVVLTCRAGGHVAFVLQWLLGLKLLGHDVLFVNTISKFEGEQQKREVQSFVRTVESYWNLDRSVLLDVGNHSALAGITYADLKTFTTAHCDSVNGPIAQSHSAPRCAREAAATSSMPWRDPLRFQFLVYR